ncbi:MAG: nucleotidyltransferase domain-containing protein [Rhodospirillaceae bacterium]|nr:nucleotidyltransferase domain-containing protein [Rhodospirillaceae bacterium]MDE0618782.1 nucleotidyltransferase domain-containing protein [Rhodospirillaceae bacterium]
MTTPDDSGADSAAGPIDDTVLQRRADAIVYATDPEKVILFGSHARGDATLAGACPFRVPKDFMVYSRNEAEYWRNSLNNVLARALREGIVLNERRSAAQGHSPRSVS